MTAKPPYGFFGCVDEPTKGMYLEADELGFFDFPRGYSFQSVGKKLAREGKQRELGL